MNYNMYLIHVLISLVTWQAPGNPQSGFLYVGNRHDDVYHSCIYHNPGRLST